MGFGNYKKQAPQAGKTVPYPMRSLRNPDGSHPILHVQHLGEVNRPYWLEQLARSSAKVKSTAQLGTSPTDMDKYNRELREENRADVANHSVQRLENTFHEDGTAATESDIKAFVLQLPDTDFDRLFAFVSTDANFRDYPIATPAPVLAEK